MRTHSLPSTRYFALENNVRLRRKIFFSALTTEETAVESTTPDIVGSEDGLLVGKVVRVYLDEIQ